MFPVCIAAYTTGLNAGFSHERRSHTRRMFTLNRLYTRLLKIRSLGRRLINTLENAPIARLAILALQGHIGF
jgi:hypothetical protein